MISYTYYYFSIALTAAGVLTSADQMKRELGVYQLGYEMLWCNATILLTSQLVKTAQINKNWFRPGYSIFQKILTFSDGKANI